MEPTETTQDPSALADLTGRVAIVTGAGQGLGRVFAKAFSAAGAIPVIAEVNRAKAQAVAEEIRGAGGRVLVVETDVSSPASTERLAGEVMERLGRIDVLVNNAAIFSTLEMRPFYEIPLDEWQRVIDVNVTGVLHCCRAVVPHMIGARRGRIINISSGSVTQGRPNYLHYTTSKSALIGMTRSMARELGPLGITVNAVLPGATFTEIERKTVTPKQKEVIVASQCIPRPERPEDLVGTVLFLASDGSAFMTGQSLTVDGGATHL